MDNQLSGSEKLRSIIQTLNERRNSLSNEESLSQLKGNLGKLGVDIQRILQREDKEARDAVAALKDHWALLAELVDVVDQEIQTLDDALALRNKKRHPAYYLPVEILSRIFEDACLTPDEQETFDSFSRFAITASCKRWRNVALNTSSLWTTWIVFLDRHYSDCVDLATKFGRARGRPIYLRINTGENPHNGIQYIVSKNVDRVEFISLTLDEYLDVGKWHLFQRPTIQFPLLRAFTVRETKCDRAYNTEGFPLDLSGAPNLNTFRFEGGRLSNYRLKCSFADLSILVNLCLTSIADTNGVLTLLYACINLETLVWDGLHPIEALDDGAQWLKEGRAISLPALVRLHLSYFSSCYLPLLNTPLLYQLQFSPAAMEVGWLGHYPRLGVVELRGMAVASLGINRHKVRDFLLRHTGVHSISFDGAIDSPILDVLGDQKETRVGDNLRPRLLFPNLNKLRVYFEGWPVDFWLDHLKALFLRRANWQIGDPRRGSQGDDPDYKRLELHATMPSGYRKGDQRKLKMLQSLYGDQVLEDVFHLTFHRWDGDVVWGLGLDEWVDLFL